MNDLRVLQLIDSLDAGGAERVAVNIANALVGKVQLSSLCVTRKEGSLKQNINEGVTYLFLNKKSVFDYKAIKNLKKYIITKNINVIHAHSSSFFLAVIIKKLLIKKNIKLIWHDHYGNSEFLEKRKSLILKVFSKSFSGIVSVNKRLANWSNNYLKHRNVEYLPNFAVIDEVQPRTNLKGVDGNRIICLANLRPQKDHFTLLKAFKKVINEYPLWTLHLVGKDLNDEYSKKVKSEIEYLNIANNVFLYGSCSDIGNMLSQCKIGVLTSKSEGLPLSLLEYGLSGLAVIVTNVGECESVVGTDNKNGLVVEPNSSEAIYEAIKKLIENDSLRNKTAKSFQQKIYKDYSKKSVTNKLIEIYR